MFKYKAIQEKLLEVMAIREKQSLSSGGFFSRNTKGRFSSEDLDIRSCFMRDRDRIIHSASFRRLKDKAQVFLLPKNDMVRTRLTHTLEVSQIARTVAVILGFNEPLTEAIALGHDLGHTPFGHIGEEALKNLSQEWFKDGKHFREIDFLNTGKNWVNISLNQFRHNIQSLRIVDFLENKGKGLNLTFEVRDGILNHSKWGKGIINTDKNFLPSTLEGQIVRIADRIAYVNHDLQDAIKTQSMSIKDIPTDLLDILGHTHSERINRAVYSLIYNYEQSGLITLDKDLGDGVDAMYAFLGKKIYKTEQMEKEKEKAIFLIKQLAYFYETNNNVIESKMGDIDYPKQTSVRTKIIDYIANMTDHYILQEFQKHLVPCSWI